MSLSSFGWRAAASWPALLLALGLAPEPAHSQVSNAAPPRASKEILTQPPLWQGAGVSLGTSLAPTWVKLCESGQPKDSGERSQGIASPSEVCTTMAEHIDPGTGKVLVGVSLRQVKQDGADRNVLTLTVAPGVAREKGAVITVLPHDLWSKVQQNVRLDSADHLRLKARTVKLPFKRCTEAGCVAEAVATPLLIDLLKGNAGLLVLTVRTRSNRPIAQAMALSGFAQALEGAPIDSKNLKEVRAQQLKEAEAQRKLQGKSSSDATARLGASWVRVCDTAKVKARTRDGSLVDKTVDLCMTTTEPIHPRTGRILMVATLAHGSVDGRQKQIFSITVPGAVRQASGATMAVLPADLWRKVKRKEKLDSSDESRLEASTVRLDVKFCVAVGCHAQIDATPELIDMLKGGAGLRVRTERISGKRDTQLLSLDGFEQALSGPPTTMKAFREAREQLVRDIAARQKRLRREEQAKKRKEQE